MATNAQIVELAFTARLMANDRTDEVVPYANVLTKDGWAQSGREIVDGELAEIVSVWKPIKATDDDAKGKKRKFVRVFAHLYHECQTKPIGTETPADHKPLAK